MRAADHPILEVVLAHGCFFISFFAGLLELGFASNRCEFGIEPRNAGSARTFVFIPALITVVIGATRAAMEVPLCFRDCFFECPVASLGPTGTTSPADEITCCAEKAAKDSFRRAEEVIDGADCVRLEPRAPCFTAMLAVKLELEAVVVGEVLTIVREADFAHGWESCGG